MAKQCAVCKQFYEDHLPACPHCLASSVSSRAGEDEHVDLGTLPPGQASDSSASAKALEALLADSAGDDVVEVLPEADSGQREKPDTGAHPPGGPMEPAKAPSSGQQHAADDVDMHDVVEDFRTKGSGIRQRPPTGIDIIGMMEGPLDIMPELPSGLHPPAPPTPAETRHVVEILPEAQPAPPCRAEEEVLDTEQLLVAEPASSTSGVTPIVAEAVETPSDDIELGEPVVIAGAPASGTTGSGVVDVGPASGIDIEAIEVAGPSSSISSKETPPAEAASESQILSTLLGPETAPPAALEEDASALDVEDSAILAEPISSTSGEMYVAPAAAESPSGSIMVVEAAEEAPPASGIVVAGREPAVDLPAGEVPGPKMVGNVPNLELDSKIQKGAGAEEEILDAVEVAETASGSMNPVDVVEVAETASGVMPPSAPASGVKPAEEPAGVFDDGEEVLDVTEEASSAALGSSPSVRPPAAAPASGVPPAHAAEDADVLDAEEVLEGAEASGKVPSDIMSEVLESGVDLGGSGKVEVPSSSALDLGGPPPGSSRKGRGSSPVLDEKGIEDLLMGPEEGAPPSSRRQPASGVVEESRRAGMAEEEEVAAPSEPAAAGEKKPAAKPKKKAGRGLQLTPVQSLAAGVGVGVVLLAAIAASSWMVARTTAMNILGVQGNAEAKKALADAKAANDAALQKQMTAVKAAQQDKTHMEEALQAAKQAATQAKEQAEKDMKKAEKDMAKAEAANKLVGALATQLKVQPDALPKAVKDLADARNDLDARLKDIDEKLKAAKVEGEGPVGVTKLADDKSKLEREREELDSTIKGAFDVLKSQGLAPADVDPRKGLVEAIKMAVDKAKNPVVISQNPEQKLDTWIALLQDRSRNDPAYVNVARGDGERVLADPRASEAEKAKAQYVVALADRNSGQMTQAQEAFGKAIKAAAAAKAGALAKVAGETLRELTDASGYYLPRVQRLEAAGDLKGALAELDVAVKQNPNDGRLHARRALVRVEMQPSGKVDPAAQNLIRQDAEAARGDPRTAAEGAYVLGRLDEELGNYDAAEKQYRAALEAHKGNPEEASRYIIALARVLQRERSAPAEAAPAQPEEKKGQGAKTDGASLSPRPSSLAPLVLAALVGLQPPEEEVDAATTARLRESIDLAKQLIKSADPKVQGQGYILMGQALSRQGKRSEGLQLYVKGMQLAYPGEATRELSRLVDVGPAIQAPERVAPVETFVAERHYGKGLHEFWKGQYAAAEDDFARAVAAYDQDARYYYYRGLSRLLQRTTAKQKLARRDFETGARLEAENRPGPRMVNASLERLQGQWRYYLDEFRQKQQ